MGLLSGPFLVQVVIPRFRAWFRGLLVQSRHPTFSGLVSGPFLVQTRHPTLSALVSGPFLVQTRHPTLSALVSGADLAGRSQKNP